MGMSIGDEHLAEQLESNGYTRERLYSLSQRLGQVARGLTEKGNKHLNNMTGFQGLNNQLPGTNDEIRRVNFNNTLGIGICAGFMLLGSDIAGGLSGLTAYFSGLEALPEAHNEAPVDNATPDNDKFAA